MDSFLQNILEWDKDLFLFLNGFYNDFWDSIMFLITRKETWFPLFITIIWFVVKNYRKKAILIIIGIILVVVAADQLSVLMKVTIQRLRPVYEPSIADIVHNVLRKGGRYSFVSSHAANSVGILVFTSRIFKRKNYYLMMLIWVLLFCYSRIYSGVHYPIDLIGGALLGWVIGYLIYRIVLFIEDHFFFSMSPQIRKTRLKKKDTGIIWLVYFVIISAIFIISGLFHYYDYL